MGTLANITKMKKFIALLSLSVLYIFLSLLLTGCVKDNPNVNDEYTPEPFVPQYYYLKGFMMDSVTGMPANGVYVSQVIVGGGCIQTVEVINGDFFLTYCTSLVNYPDEWSQQEVGHLGGSATIALAQTPPVNALTAYKLVWMYFTPVEPGDTAQVTVWTSVE